MITVDRLRGMVPYAYRVRIHAAVPALFTLLVAVGVLTDVKAAAVSGLVLVVADMGLSTLHATTSLRTFVYPVVGAVATAAVSYGLVEEQVAGMVLAVLASVAGSATAARFAGSSR